MTTKRIVSLLVGSAVVAILLVAVMGANPAWPGYQLDGTWHGTTTVPTPGGNVELPWIASYSSTGAARGTCVVEVMGFPYPRSAGRGVWQRTGPRAFSYTVLAYVDVPGLGLVEAKESGVIELTDPDTMVVEAWVWVEMLGECTKMTPCTGTRLRVEEPCSSLE